VRNPENALLRVAISPYVQGRRLDAPDPPHYKRHVGEGEFSA
jgi:hypothetical protein